MASGEDVRDLIPPNETIRYIHVAKRPTIGALRNLGCARAQGDIVAHWDDDDFSAPERLRDQIDRLGGFAVTGYVSMRFTDGQSWWQYEYRQPGYILGTSLCYRKEWWQSHPFEDIQIGEEVKFSKAALGSCVVADAGDLMYATIHPGNTSPRRLDPPNWRKL